MYRAIRGPMPAAARKPQESPRSRLCRELLEIERDNAILFARIDALKTELKDIAKREGKFRETFVGLGYVSVSPAAPEQITGEAPVLQVAAWQELRDQRRDKLLEDGLVRIEPIVKGASYGQVRVNLHATA